MSIYEFKIDDAYRFASDQHIKVSRRGDELQFKECPYCHSSKDKKTFSINIKTGMFKCLRASCNAHGNMITLHQDFGFDLGTDVAEYERPSYTWKRFKVDKPKESTTAAIEYLKGRGIDEDTIRKYEICTKKGEDNILVFPFYEDAETIAMIKYRKTDFNPAFDNNKEWSEKDMKAILFGMKQCDINVSDTLVITEGQIDSLSVASCGIPNAVSVPTGKNGMTWVPHCWDWMQQWKTIIVFGDCERDEITLAKDVKARFSDKQVRIVRKADYLGCKDANEILQKHGKEAIIRAVENSEVQMLDQVKRLCDVSYSEEHEKLPTGIHNLDMYLKGGLPFGFVNIITGKRGDGKSTFASMITKQALEANHSVFIYSGEMQPGDVRKVLDSQIAGDDRLEERQFTNYSVWNLSKANREIIANWYKDRAYIYDTTQAMKSTEKEDDITKLIETYICQFGCRVVLIDNLMTAIDYMHNNLTKFEKQEQFVKELSRIAYRYNALILLVAHKKKDQKGFESDENDDVLGSSEITNLAGTVVSYGRGKEISDQQRLCKLTKNRLEGKLNMDGFVLDYSEASKRIFEHGYSAKIESPCFKTEAINIPITESDLEEIPF